MLDVEKEMSNFPNLISKLMEFIVEIKKTDSEKELSLIDIIVEYCSRFDLDIQIVGEAISMDVYFKSFIQTDCELRKIFKLKKPVMDTW